MNLTRKQAMDKYLGVVKMALDRGIVPRCHFEDITRADFYGFVVPFAHALAGLSEEAGIPIKIRCCDTLGPAWRTPARARAAQRAGHHLRPASLRQRTELALEWHGHNDFYKAVSTAAAAWNFYGASAANCSLLALASAPATARWKAWSWSIARSAEIRTA